MSSTEVTRLLHINQDGEITYDKSVTQNTKQKELKAKFKQLRQNIIKDEPNNGLVIVYYANREEDFMKDLRKTEDHKKRLRVCRVLLTDKDTCNQLGANYKMDKDLMETLMKDGMLYAESWEDVAGTDDKRLSNLPNWVVEEQKSRWKEVTHKGVYYHKVTPEFSETRLTLDVDECNRMILATLRDVKRPGCALDWLRRRGVSDMAYVCAYYYTERRKFALPLDACSISVEDVADFSDWWEKSTKGGAPTSTGLLKGALKLTPLVTMTSCVNDPVTNIVKTFLSPCIYEIERPVFFKEVILPLLQLADVSATGGDFDYSKDTCFIMRDLYCVGNVGALGPAHDFKTLSVNDKLSLPVIMSTNTRGNKINVDWYMYLLPMGLVKIYNLKRDQIELGVLSYVLQEIYVLKEVSIYSVLQTQKYDGLFHHQKLR